MQEKIKRYTKNKRNRHRVDEMPKNSISKLISTHSSACKAMIETLNKQCIGHKLRKGGHRIVSGLIRANLKRETQKEIKEELNG